MSDEYFPQLITLGLVHADARWHIGPEYHPYHELLRVVEGEVEVRIQGRRICGKPGDILFYPAWVEHEETASLFGETRAHFIAFSDSQTHHDLPIHSQDTQQRILQLLYWINEEAAANNDDTLADRVGAFIAAVLKQMQYHDYHLLPDMVGVVREYIRQHFSEPLSLEDLAEAAELTPSHFNRRFKQITGVTPMADLRRTRLYMGRYYLLNTSWNLRQVAEGVGFKNEFHFSRAFKRQFGVAPAHFRKQLRLTPGSSPDRSAEE